MKHTILVIAFAIPALVTVGWIANGHIERLTAERDEARRSWCWLSDVEGYGPASDGDWRGSLYGDEDRAQYDDWCADLPSPAEWYGVE